MQHIVAIYLQIVYFIYVREVFMEVKYHYQDITVYLFCKINELIYKNVIGSILYYKKRYMNYAQDINRTIDMVLKKQIILTERKKQKIAFLEILNNEINITKGAKALNINVQAVYKLKKYGFSAKDSIIILYFLADCNIQDRKISKKRINEILNELKSYNYTKDYAHLFCYYYLECDTITHIINLSKSMLTYNIHSVANYYCMKLTPEDLEDILQNINMKIIEMINEKKILLNGSSQIKSYIYKSVKKQIYDSLKEIKMYANQAHFEDEIGENRTLMDIIPNEYDRWR